MSKTLFDSFIDWLLDLHEKFTVPYHDRQFQTLLTLKGTITQPKQSHYDPKAGGWVFVEEVTEVQYVLKYNNLGRYGFEFRCSKHFPEHVIKQTEEYIQVVEPWLEGQLDSSDTLRRLYEEYPDRIVVPSAACFNLPPLKQPTNGQVVSGMVQTLLTNQSASNDSSPPPGSIPLAH